MPDEGPPLELEVGQLSVSSEALPVDAPVASIDDQPLHVRVLTAVEQVLRAAVDQSHYSTDYATNWHASVGQLLPDIARGIYQLRRPPLLEIVAEGTLIRIDTRSIALESVRCV